MGSSIEFNRNNLEREKAGLPPLDICTEKYYFDKKWADNEPECAARIIRYESGERTALGTQVLIIEEKEVEGVQE